MSAAHVSRINVSPVKSLRLHHPDSLWLDRFGAREDRRFLLVDDRGRVYNGNRDGALVRADARWDPPSRRLVMSVPGAGVVEGEAVRGAQTLVEVYGRPVRGYVVEGPWAAALSELAGRPLTLVERRDRAWATDIRPVTVVSQASLDLVGGDGRRFRMLLEIEGLETLEEETWRDRRVRIGEAVLIVGDPTPRCSTPSADPDTGRRNRDVLRELIDVRGAVNGLACLGVYAEVLKAGVVRVGDEVEAAAPEGRSTSLLVDRARLSGRRLARLRERAARYPGGSLVP